ncbi:MAG: WS/DGAT domain-containing protein, partial [Mycobacteriaceae bacterium]
RVTMTSVSRERMAAADAQLLWLSAKVPNDQFLLYVFDGAPDIPAGLRQVRRNAEGFDELRMRVCDDSRWRYPQWVLGEVAAEQFVVHEAGGSGDWRGSLASVARLGRLDATRTTWRVHVFRPAVVVVQMSHALGDGTRSAALAAALFGRRVAIGAVTPDRGNLLWRGIGAARAHRGMVREVRAGLLAPPPAARPALSVNSRPAGTPVLRTLVVDRVRMRRPTVTVAALSAVAEALGGYLADRGEDISLLGAEVPMAGPPTANARNNFRNVSVGLHPQLDRDRRVARIGAELDAQRRRSGHPATAASTAAFAAVPAPLLRWGMSQFDAAARSSTVSGHTVVSSVNRGPADLTFGGRRVVLTAGYPALSPMMSLTHGIHGIGDVVAVSVHADASVVDVDGYLDRLAHALGCQP